MKSNSITVRELYDASVIDGSPLLSEYNGAFWVKYTANHADYDMAFLAYYESFKFTSPAPTLENWRDMCKAILTVNATKYNELFRMEDLPDDAYNILQNYDVTETMQKTISADGTENIGQREDTETLSQTGTNTTVHTGDDSVEYGEQGVDTMVSNPNRESTTEQSVAAFDSADYSPREKVVNKENSYAVDTQVTNNAHTDVTTYNNTDTLTRDLTDNKSAIIGAQENTHKENGKEDYTLMRKGNIGVQTQSDMLLKHLELWDGYEFYTKIFRDIADVLLLADLADCLVD